mgnify:CR=1 FL=1
MASTGRDTRAGFTLIEMVIVIVVTVIIISVINCSSDSPMQQ